MPELPEVETSCRGIAPHIEGYRVKQVTVRQHQLRWLIPSDLPEHLEGHELLSVRRRAKYLLLQFRHGFLVLHLGMSGSLRVVNWDVEPGKHDHVDIVFGPDQVLRLNDPRRFGAVLWVSGDKTALQQHPLLAHLGPEPLGDAFTGAYLFEQTRKRKKAIKLLIMDAHVVVGVGNIYANEALFKAGIRPSKSAGTVTKNQCLVLAAEIKAVLSRAIEQGGTSLKDFVGGDGKPGYFKQELLVYGRKGLPCTVCHKPLKETRLGQRSTVYCTHCQG